MHGQSGEINSFYHLFLHRKKSNMNKVILLISLITCINGSIAAQYYYKDIISNKQSNADLANYKENKIRNIRIHSFEANGEESKGFYCEKKINKNYTKITTYTKSFVSDKSMLTSFYNENGQITESRDSSELSVAASFFRYDVKGNLISVTSTAHSADEDFLTSHTEEHLYQYNEKGSPEKMFRIKNKKDTAIIDFLTDEKGNVTDEIDINKFGIHYYYYYDAKKRLTDIVKYNVPKAKLLPDVMFEYNYDGQLAQMLTREEGATTDYFTWKYVYNDGLRIIEKCFSKEKTLMGYFEYEYN